MNLEAHVQKLNEKHANIDHVIHMEEHRPNPDTIRITDLKRQKLRLKEELSRLRSH